MVKRGLGKGLEALIPPLSTLEEGEEMVQMIPLENIVPNTYQPRRDFDEEKLQELADSIKEHGMVQPIVVRKIGDEEYEVAAGERRLRACKMLNIDKVPAVVKDINDQQVTEIALIENIQREDLNPIEEAWAYKTLIQEFDLTQSELSERVGKSRPFIANMLRLLNLSQEIQEYATKGILSVGHARALLAVEKQEMQLEIAKKAAAEQMTVRELENYIRKIIEKGTEEEGKKKSTQEEEFIQEDEVLKKSVEEKLQEFLGTKVKLVEKSKEKGKIEIEYYTWEDLERIVEMLTGFEE